MDITHRTTEQLAADLATAQQALRDIVMILSIATNHQNFYYEVGRAQGTARMGLAMSGAQETK